MQAIKNGPVATTFENSDGERKQLYLSNNPCKSQNTIDLVFRYCVLCAENRYSDDDWKALKPATHGGFNRLFCKKCEHFANYAPNYIPRALLEINLSIEKKNHEVRILNLPPITKGPTNKKVFKNPAAIPEKYRDKILEFEKLPHIFRSDQVETEIFQYCKNNNPTENDLYLELLENCKEECENLAQCKEEN